MNILGALKDFFLYDPKSPLLFNSGMFLASFSIFLIVYTLIYQRSKLGMILWVTAFSYFFYYKSSGIYFILLVITAISDYGFALLIDKATKQWQRKLWLALALIMSFGLLAYFKYTNFIIFNITAIIGGNFSPLDIFLPVGISFYTFQSVSYVLDVYWKKLPPTRNFLHYSFFLAYFPQLVAGPIVKANLFLPQMEKIRVITKEAVYSGAWLIIVGLIKKGLIADYIAQYNDMVFSNPTGYSGFENLMAIYGYTLQIYCDFSGYSDMAIGIGRIMGYDLGINFNLPYKSLNITDFWRRWHISLSSWLRDYLYISLGGNRKGKLRTYINLFITMLLGGLWHGASWRFVFWGAMHGVGLAIHKASKGKLDKIPEDYVGTFFAWFMKIIKIPANAIKSIIKYTPTLTMSNFLPWALTFHFVIFLWVFFRANDVLFDVMMPVFNGVSTIQVPVKFTVSGFDVAWIMIQKVLTQTDFGFFATFFQARYIWVILIVIGFLMHTTPAKWNTNIMNLFVKVPFIAKVFIFIIVVQLVIQFKSEFVQPFIYFQF